MQVEGTDAVVNLSVMRLDRKLAFDVNTKGVYNAILAAVAAKHDRFINTGPHFTVVGTLYDDYDFGRPLGVLHNVDALDGDCHPGPSVWLNG